MKKFIVILAFILFALSSPAISKQITSHLKMVDGYLDGTLTANDDEPIWYGDYEFDFLEGMHFTCKMVSLHTSGADPINLTSVSYRCQNGFSVVIEKKLSEKYATIKTESINFKTGETIDRGEIKVTSSVPLTMIEHNNYNSKMFDKRIMDRERWLKDNTMDVFDACNIIMSSHMLAYQLVNAGAPNSNEGKKQMSEALSKLYPKNGDAMTQAIIDFHSKDKDPFGMPLTFGLKGRLIQMCRAEPENYIPEFGPLVMSGKIFR
ncbi:TPA: hypothetical protein ACYEP6_000857 [Klebsiella variicola]